MSYLKYMCGNLSDNGHHRLIYLMALLPSLWNYLAWIRKYDLVGGGELPGVGCENSKAQAILIV